MNNTTLSDDLAYIRDLAEAGEGAPLLGGRFLTFWGGLTTLAYVLHYGIESGLFGWPSIAFAGVWGGFILIGSLGQFVLGYTIRNKPGGSSVGNRVEATVWMAGGFALFAFFATHIIKSAITDQSAEVLETSLPIVFAIYGTGLITSGFIARQRVLTYAGFGALAMIALAIWFEGTAYVWAVASVAAFLTMFIPGLILLRQEPKSVV